MYSNAVVAQSWRSHRETSGQGGPRGCGRGYSQRSEAEQLLKRAPLNFIDLVMPQVTEKERVPKMDVRVNVSDRLPRTFYARIRCPSSKEPRTRGGLTGSVAISQSRDWVFVSYITLHFYNHLSIASLSKKLVLSRESRTIPTCTAIIQWEGRWLSVQEGSASVPPLHKPGMLVHAWLVPDDEVILDYEANLGYMRAFLKRQNKTGTLEKISSVAMLPHTSVGFELDCP